MKRTSDPTFINQVVNNPEVVDWIRGPLEIPIDLTPLAENQDNHLLVDDCGGFLFVKKRGLPLYEVHTQFLPGTRGVLDKAKEAAFYMFTKTDCIEIMTCVPSINVAARRLTKQMQFEYVGRKGEWPINGVKYPLDYYTLTIKRWATKLCQQ
ncbi:MAG: hypothetical protein KGL39_08915 [Patescibacteria group bacterium]|nr:hypothetical protein [Patescibacteria group bacterium]